MTGRHWAGIALAAGGLIGCNEPGKRLNAPPHGRSQETTDMQGTFTYMSDNAALTMMTVNDTHFVPGRGMLNSQGEQRLDRLASLIDAYGGQVRFNTDGTDGTLNGQRMASIREYLIDCGLNPRGDLVVMGIPGGEGSLAEEAILIRQHEGMYQPQRGGSGPGGSATAGGSNP